MLELDDIYMFLLRQPNQEYEPKRLANDPPGVFSDRELLPRFLDMYPIGPVRVVQSRVQWECK